MLDALGVGFGRLARRADGDEEVDHQAVALAGAFGHRLAGRGQENAAIGLGPRQPFALQPRDRLARGRMGDAEMIGDVGHARFAVGGVQIGDELGIVFEDRRRSRLPRLAEAARMGRGGDVLDAVHPAPSG